MSKTQQDFSPLSFITFGDLLRYLRERAHLSQRELAVLVGYHFSYISYLEKNTRIVDEATLMGRFVPALALENQPEWVARLLDLSKNKKEETPILTGGQESAVSEANVNFLPTSLTVMVGREYESARLRKLILDPGIRLITVMGPPGVGKTCLALNVAGKIFSAFKHGVVFVDLTPVRSPIMLFPSLALALGIPETSRTSLEDAIKNSIAKKNLLLLLDNFEQIVDAAPQLLPLLGAAPGVKLLLTSRENLRLRGEHEFHLEPLPVPGDASLETLLDYPCVNLFVDRARAVKPEFKLDEKNASLVAEICSRLDGLPLAIELAAARIHSLSLPTMLEQFDRRFEWLTQGARDLPAWRQTLQGAIEWSYNLLSEKERALFARLSLFNGGWTLQSAEEICSDDDLCSHPEILNLLLQLVDKSLVVADGERYRFLETLREFAHNKLHESDELEALQEQHFDFYFQIAETVRTHLALGGDQVHSLNQVEIEYDNLRAALTWTCESPTRAARAMQLGSALGGFWLTRGYITEGRRWLDKILSLDPAPSTFRAKILSRASDFASSQGDLEAARDFEEEGLAISKTLGDESGVFYSMDGLAVMAGMQGEYARAAELLEQVLVYRRRVKDPVNLLTTMNNLAVASHRLGNLERAKELYVEAIKINEETGNDKSLAHGLNGLAEVHVQLQEYETALQLHRKSIFLRHRLGDMKGIAYSLNGIAMLMEYLDNSLLAAKLESAADTIRRELGLTIAPAALAEHKDFLKKLRKKLGDKRFEKAWAEGQSLSRDQAVALAMGNAE